MVDGCIYKFFDFFDEGVESIVYFLSGFGRGFYVGYVVVVRYLFGLFIFYGLCL